MTPVSTQNIIKGLRSNDPTLIGLYIGVWCGDGTQYYDKGYRVKICCNSNNLKMIDFIKSVLFELFGKNVLHVAKETRHRSLIRFNSKFIYNFVKQYVKFGGNKTHTISLKSRVKDYENCFLSGFVLGLTLTDGYLKGRFVFNVTSKRLAQNLYEILQLWGLNPKLSVTDRSKYGWQDLVSVRLGVVESNNILSILDKTLEALSSKSSFLELKYEQNGPAETFQLQKETF